MNAVLREGIHWVGYTDWSVRDFHGYETDRGTSYNAYLICDEKNVLIDTVKAPYAGNLLEHISAQVRPSELAYVVCNHAEPDHAGGLPQVMRACPQAELICSAKCRDALSRHHNTAGWKFRVVATGDTLSLGRRTLTFTETPMVHWPESMFTYCPEEKILFSMDAFGQHIATSRRFDDEESIEVIMADAKTYYANILMLYPKPIAKALDSVAGLPIEMIAPSHGVIWRANIGRIVEAYRRWTSMKPTRKVLVVYDSMWESTATMAQAIHEGASQKDVDARLLPVRSTSATVVATEILDAASFAVGTPTLNQAMMPAVAGLLTYLQGLKPIGKAGLAFGSYGWASRGTKDVDQVLRNMKLEILQDPLEVQFSPDAAALERCREAGRRLAQRAIELAAV